LTRSDGNSMKDALDLTLDKLLLLFWPRMTLKIKN